jgi:hypothetical protein
MSSSRLYSVSTDLAPHVRNPAREAYYTAELMQGRQSDEKAEGRPLTEARKDDATRVGATMDLSLYRFLHTRDRRCDTSIVPLVIAWGECSNVEPTWTVVTCIKSDWLRRTEVTDKLGR